MEKKSLITLGTIAIGSTFSLIGCSTDFDVKMNHNMDVYGPAIQDEIAITEEVVQDIKNDTTENNNEGFGDKKENTKNQDTKTTPTIERVSTQENNINEEKFSNNENKKNSENKKNDDVELEHYFVFIPSENEVICMYGPRPTSIPIPTNSPIPTSTPIPTNTPKPTSVPTPTSTPKPTSTPIPYVPDSGENYVMYGPVTPNPTIIVTPTPSVDAPITTMYGPVVSPIEPSIGDDIYIDGGIIETNPCVYGPAIYYYDDEN